MEASQTQDSQALGPTTPPKRILLVEDDNSLANIYMLRLQAEGLDVRRVDNGEEALAVALDFQPHLVMLDIMMPKIDGLNVLEILRGTPETTNLKAIMLTALDQASYQQRARELGADRYLVKTQVTLEDIVNTVKSLLPPSKV